jgi:hypothetical protein
VCSCIYSGKALRIGGQSQIPPPLRCRWLVVRILSRNFALGSASRRSVPKNAKTGRPGVSPNMRKDNSCTGVDTQLDTTQRRIRFVNTGLVPLPPRIRLASLWESSLDSFWPTCLLPFAADVPSGCRAEIHAWTSRRYPFITFRRLLSRGMEDAIRGCQKRSFSPSRHGSSGVFSGLAAACDLDFRSLPLLVGLRPGKPDGDPPRVWLEVFAADPGQCGSS